MTFTKDTIGFHTICKEGDFGLEVAYAQVGIIENGYFTGIIHGYEGGGVHSEGFFYKNRLVRSLNDELVTEEDMFIDLVGEESYNFLYTELFETKMTQRDKDSCDYIITEEQKEMFQVFKCDNNLYVLTNGSKMIPLTYGTRTFDRTEEAGLVPVDTNIYEVYYDKGEDEFTEHIFSGYYEDCKRVQETVDKNNRTPYSIEIGISKMYE